MRIGITGAGGQLGRELRQHFESMGFTVFAFTRRELDICNENLLRIAVSELNLTFIINCAAYTDVDLAEKHPGTAFQINAEGPANLARLCKLEDIGLVHISTDSVFSSTEPDYFMVTQITNPINVYGLSKDAGEKAILAEYPERSWIIRTAWIYGDFGGRFVHTIMEKARGNQPLTVVDDQFGQPISTSAFATYVGALMKSNLGAGIYHFASSDYVSRFEFARTIYSSLKVDPGLILPTSTIPNSLIAKRSKYSLLDTIGAESDVSIKVESWKDYLTAFLEGTGRIPTHG
jgi:dTDP-4-dehydrorhamnose reductase